MPAPKRPSLPGHVTKKSDSENTSGTSDSECDSDTSDTSDEVYGQQPNNCYLGPPSTLEDRSSEAMWGSENQVS